MAPWKDWSLSKGLLKRTIETIEQDGKPCPSLLKTKNCASLKCPSKIKKLFQIEIQMDENCLSLIEFGIHFKVQMQWKRIYFSFKATPKEEYMRKQ